jgi:DNA replication protein DnaC
LKQKQREEESQRSIKALIEKYDLSGWSEDQKRKLNRCLDTGLAVPDKIEVSCGICREIATLTLLQFVELHCDGRKVYYCGECRKQGGLIKFQNKLVQHGFQPLDYHNSLRNWDTEKYPDEQTEIIEKAKAYIADPHRDLYIYGKTGTGKTKIAKTIGVRLIYKGCEVHWSTYGKIVRDAESRRSDWAKEYESAPYLIIDDFVLDPSIWTEKVIAVVKNRYDAGKRTIITSNSDPEQLKSFESTLAQQFASRMAAAEQILFLITEDLRVYYGG